MRRDSDRVALFAFRLAILVIFLAASFFFGAIAYRDDLPPFPQLRLARDVVDQGASMFVSPAREHLKVARGQGSGVTVGDGLGDDALIMLAGFFEDENQIRLIRRDGTVVRKWSLDYFEHFPDKDRRPCNIGSPLLVDTHGALVTPEGQVVFNYEYCGTVKLDQCGDVVWTVDEWTHHSLTRSEEGGFWVLGRSGWIAGDDPERFPPFSEQWPSAKIVEDKIMHVGDDGAILEEKSIPAVMRQNGLGALLTATGRIFGRRSHVDQEIVHSNKVAELPSDIADAFPLFEAGDLAISLRDLNLILVVDPDSWKVKWHRTGPWVRQHDPEFRADGVLSVFNNNVYHTAYAGIRDREVDLETPFTTNIITVDPVTGATEVVFGEAPGEEMLSVIRGQHELLEDDGILITEFDAGRVLEVDGERRTVWEYVNRYDEEYVGEISNADLYPEGYFETAWRECSR